MPEPLTLPALSDESINAIFAGLHKSGTMRHYRSHYVDGYSIDLQVGCPQLVGSAAKDAEGRTAFAARTRLSAHLKRSSDSGTSGLNVNADLTVRVAIDGPRARAAGDGQVLELEVDWSGTSEGDIEVYGNSNAALVKLAILDLVHRYGGGLFAAGIIDPAQLRDRGDRSLEPPTLESGDGWAVRVPERAVLREVRRGIRRSMAATESTGSTSTGDLVAGTQVVSDPKKPWELQVVTRQLEAVEAEIRGNEIEVVVRVADSSWHQDRPSKREVQAIEFRLQAREAEPVELALATTAEATVVNAAAQSLVSLIPGKADDRGRTGEPWWDLLARMCGHQRLEDLGLEARVTSVGLDPTGLIVRGELIETSADTPAVASFVCLPGSTGLTRVMHAGESWAPGDRLTQFHWDFGDGTEVTSSDPEVQFVVEHQYRVPGTYEVQLTVIGSNGANGSASASVAIGQLTVIPLGRSRTRRLRIGRGEPVAFLQREFAVYDDGAPVVDAIVRVAGGTTGRTNAEGRVWLQSVSDADGAELEVEARKDGYEVATQLKA